MKVINKKNCLKTTALGWVTAATLLHLELFGNLQEFTVCAIWHRVIGLQRNGFSLLFGKCLFRISAATSTIPWKKFLTPKHCCTYIQGVSRLVDITAGGDFLGLCDQKSSFKHVSDFGRLRSFGNFLISVHALVWTALRNQLAGDVLNSVAYRLRCKHYFCHLTRPPIYRQSSFRITPLGT